MRNPDNGSTVKSERIEEQLINNEQEKTNDEESMRMGEIERKEVPRIAASKPPLLGGPWETVQTVSG